MALPDWFERVGIVVGSVFLVALPASALISALYGFALDPWIAAVVTLGPGLVGGVVLAGDRLPVTYHQVWALSVSSYLLVFAGWAAFDISTPAADRSFAVLLWIVAVGLGALIAWARPVATLTGRLRRART